MDSPHLDVELLAFREWLRAQSKAPGTAGTYSRTIRSLRLGGFDPTDLVVRNTEGPVVRAACRWWTRWKQLPTVVINTPHPHTNGALRQFVAWSEASVTPATALQHSRLVHRLLQHLEGAELTSLTPDRLRAAEAADDLRPGQRVALRRAWARFVAFGAARGIVLADFPSTEVHLPQQAAVALLRLTRACGVPLKDIPQLSWAHVESARGGLRIRKLGSTGTRYYAVQSTSDLHDALSRLLAYGEPTTEDAPLVPDEPGGVQPASFAVLQRALKELPHRADSRAPSTGHLDQLRATLQPQEPQEPQEPTVERAADEEDGVPLLSPPPLRKA